MMIFTHSTKKICFLFLLLLLILCAVWYGVWSLIKHNIDSALQNEVTIQDLENNVSHDRTLKMFLADVGPDINTLVSHVIPADGTVPFIDMTETLGRSRGLTTTVQSLEVKDAPELDSTHFELLHVVLTTTGSWNSTYTFLSLLETLPYKVTIDTMALIEQKTAKSSSWDGTISLFIVKYK